MDVYQRWRGSYFEFKVSSSVPAVAPTTATNITFDGTGNVQELLGSLISVSGDSSSYNE